MYKKPTDPARSKATLDFFKWVLEHGQSETEQLDYVPLLSSPVGRIEARGAGQGILG